MADKTPSPPEKQAVTDEEEPRQDEAIRGKVREFVSQALKGGHMDAKGVEDVVRSVTDGMSRDTMAPAADARKALLDDLEMLAGRLRETGEAAQAALAQIGSKGVDFTDNDLKETLAMFRDLQGAYVETASRLADAASGNIQRELRSLSGQGPLVGMEMGARAASVMTEFANRLTAASREGAASGIDAARDYGSRASMLASGVLAGIADALQEPSAGDKKD